MVLYSNTMKKVFIFLLLLSIIDGHFYLHSTHFVSENDFSYDCLHYKVMDDITNSIRPNDFQSPYQIIKYCICSFKNPLKPTKRIINENFVANYTFEHLRQLNITAEVLLSWSTPIDLVEQYQIYIDKLDSSLQIEIVYKCKTPWFGVFCQYTFKSDDDFSKIIQRNFHDKIYTFSNTDYQVTDITNLTCYLHLACNRGPAPICLDWREICNGQIDCRGSGVDEMNCFELEITECESDEYQCHNGMCVPEEFLNDGIYDLECLDSTDEGHRDNSMDEIFGFWDCFMDPSFRCEDAFHPHRDLDFACGDGEQNSFQIFASKYTSISFLISCRNGRNTMLRNLLLLDAEKTNLTDECWVFMSCLTYALGDPMCEDLCDDDYCDLWIYSKCNASSYVIFPMIPIFSSHVQSGYWTTTKIQYSNSVEMKRSPDFYCYDVQLCPFFSPTFEIDHRTCINHSDIHLNTSGNAVRFFDQCLTIDKRGNETNCFYRSLFHCPGTSKCISKRRLLDGFVDCYGAVDETYVDSCQLNDKHRFRCTSENKCISNTLVRDGIKHCRGGEDEMKTHETTLYYLNLCNGYTHMTPIVGDGQNETDETNCEQWPCDNLYTRCDVAWTCRNGADEVNCARSSKCNSDHHECISPVDLEVTCLPINRSGDGKMDCLGGTDERQLCKTSVTVVESYQCWNETKCVEAGCCQIMDCSFEKTIDFCNQCIKKKDIRDILLSISPDLTLITSDSTEEFYKYKHFTLNNSNLTYTPRTNKYSLDKQLHSSIISDMSIASDRKNEFHRAWICNRGILIYVSIENIEYCLCPPAYYGHRCQFQNERVSLTIKFSKECSPNCFGIYGIIVILIDENQMIHSSEQLTLQTTKNCSMKYNLNLLYQSRPKNRTMNYTIHIHAYDKHDLTYYASWILPVKFLVLPVNRIAAHLRIPPHGNDIVNQCPLGCGDHGHCHVFVNSEKSFCRCDSGWSGQQCQLQNNDCNCSPDSLCLGIVNKRSICMCPLNKIGSRCFLHPICQNDTCKNGGLCIAIDAQWSLNTITCICKQGFSGDACENQDTQLDFTFKQIEIPQSLSIYFVTVQNKNDPIITMFSKKIPFDQDKIKVFTSLSFNLIFTRIDNKYYLVYHEMAASYISHLSIKIQSSQQCSPVDELLDKQILSYPLLRRAKYYHVACRERPQLTCLYDLEGFMCLCDQERFANCLHFNFSSKSYCQQRSLCENDGECFPDRISCPNAMMCLCRECYFGTKCQLTTKGFSLSLDTILGYQIRQHASVPHQTAAVKVSIAITTTMIFIGLISGVLSTMTFNSKSLLGVGCGFYLRALSILSLVSSSLLTLKLWLLIATQSLWIINRVILWFNCISIEFILRSLPAIADWLSACVAIERTFVVIKGVSFDKNKSKRIARWIIIGVILFTLVSIIHDPIHRRLIVDEEEKRTWCVLRYSSIVQIFDSIVHIFHFTVPFSINFISSIVIIINAARIHAHARKNQPYKQHLRKQFREQKHLILSPIFIIFLGVPRLIISFLSGCMGSVRDPWLYLFGYFISFLPSLLIPIIFIFPSEIYRKQFEVILESIKKTVLGPRRGDESP